MNYMSQQGKNIFISDTYINVCHFDGKIFVDILAMFFSRFSKV
jgi:hypothetical protein